jgi:succinate dehydrogenase / fumarate reductase, cytochrome b subunit
MKWSDFFTSSIGKKFTMALTGLFLISFLVVHVGLNSCIWANDHGHMFNVAAHFMGSMVVIRIMEWGLFVGFIIHIVQAYVLELQNRARRKVGYAVNLGNRGSKWYSRSMGLLGTILLLFLIVHLANFWVPSRFTQAGLEEVTLPDGIQIHNLYLKMMDVFQNPLIVVLYVLACASLCYHLMHGFQSAFRTLGLHNKKYIKLVSAIGFGFSIIVSLAFAMMPIGMHFGLVDR